MSWDVALKMGGTLEGAMFAVLIPQRFEYINGWRSAMNR